MIDWPRVDELRDEIGPEDFDEVVDIFIEEMGEGIEALKSDGVSTEQLHFLKGCSLNLGFEEFSALCQAGETAAAQGNADQVDLSAILDSYSATKAEFLSQLGQRFAA